MEVAKHHVFKDLFLPVFKQWAGLRELRHLLVTQPDMGEGLCFLASLLAGRRSSRGTTHVGMCWCPLASTVPFTHSGLRPRSASRDASVGTGRPSTCPLRAMWLALPGRSWATRNSTWSRGRLSRSLAATSASDEHAGGQCTGGQPPGLPSQKLLRVWVKGPLGTVRLPGLPSQKRLRASPTRKASPPPHPHPEFGGQPPLPQQIMFTLQMSTILTFQGLHQHAPQ